MMNTGQALCPSPKSEGTILSLSSLHSFCQTFALFALKVLSNSGASITAKVTKDGIEEKTIDAKRKRRQPMRASAFCLEQAAY